MLQVRRWCAYLVVAASLFSCRPRSSDSDLEAAGDGISVGLRKVAVFRNLTFTQPTHMLTAPDDKNIFYVLEKPGTIKMFPNRDDALPGDVKLAADLSARIASGDVEDVTYEEGL